MPLEHHDYRHRQFGWLLALGTLIPVVILLCLLPRATGRAATLLPMVLLPVVIAISVLVVLLFGALEVSVTRDRLAWRFGIGLVKGSVSLDSIERVKTTRTPASKGWGIRRLPNGWRYNVGGFDAIEIQQKSGQILQIGTNQPANLRLAVENAMREQAARAAEEMAGEPTID